MNNRLEVTDRLPRNLNEKAAKLFQIEKSLTEANIPEDDLQALEFDTNRIKNRIQQVQAELANATGGEDEEQLKLVRSNLRRIVKRKEELTSQHTDLLSDQGRLEEELRLKEERLHQLEDQTKLSPQEFKKFSQDIKDLANQSRNKNAVLQSLKQEYGVLVVTEEVLKKRSQLSREQVEQMERDAGTVGAAATREQLLQISKEKAEADEVKNADLEKLTEVLQDITNTLKKKKSDLAPQIKDLRKMREQYQEMETHYSEAKAKWERENSQLQMERNKLENEVASLQHLCDEQEHRYHAANMWHLRHEIKTDILKCEETLRANMSIPKDPKVWPFGPPTRPYRDVYKGKTMQLDKENKDLVTKARSVQQNYEPNMKQQKMFASLRQLLEAKNRIYRIQAGDELPDGSMPPVAARTGQSSNVMAMDMTDVGSGGQAGMAGVNRLMLSDD